MESQPISNVEKIYRGRAMHLKWAGDSIIVVAPNDDTLAEVLLALFPAVEPVRELWKDVEVRKA